jgi:hypothetical protein
MNIGDKVKFLNETGGGIITRFLDPETVIVRIEEGFEVPVKIKGLIPDQGGMSDSIPGEKIKLKDESPVVKPPEISLKDAVPQNDSAEQKNSGQVYMAFTRESNPFQVETHLINDTNYQIYFVIGLRKMGQQIYQYSGLLEPNTKVALGNYRITKTDEPTIFSVQYMGFKKGYYIPFEPVSRIIEIDTQQLVDRQYEKENDFFENAATIFRIGTMGVSGDLRFSKTTLDFPKRELLLEKENSLEKKIITEKPKLPEMMEVDLHIHEIVEDESGLTDGEILDIQLRRFEMALETALRGNIKKIIFIHGVGQGKLKYEISKIINEKYPDLKYQDASFKEYGYGAMMVLL